MIMADKPADKPAQIAPDTTVAQAALADRLAGMMREELRLCESLRGCIDRESQLLREHAHDTYLQEIPQKDAVLLELRNIEAEREILLKTLGYSSMSGAIAACPLQAQLLVPLRSALLELTQVCFHENRLLGKLINGQSRFFNFLLGNLLPGHHQALTYQPNGSRPSGSGAGKLISV